MVYFDDLSPIQERIIKRICYTQLDSLRRLYYDRSESSTDFELLLCQYEVSTEDFKNELEKRIEIFKALGKNPSKLGTLDKVDMGIFKHILTQIDHEYRSKIPVAVENLWSMLFMVTGLHEEFQMN